MDKKLLEDIASPQDLLILAHTRDKKLREDIASSQELLILAYTCDNKLFEDIAPPQELLILAYTCDKKLLLDIASPQELLILEDGLSRWEIAARTELKAWSKESRENIRGERSCLAVQSTTFLSARSRPPDREA